MPFATVVLVVCLAVTLATLVMLGIVWRQR